MVKAIGQSIPEQEAIVFRDRRLSFKQFSERSFRLANYLISRGVTLRKERQHLQTWESGQDHIALYMYNGNEYLEGMIGAMAARAVPLNINYRYVAEELLYVLRDAGCKALIYHAEFAPVVEQVLPDLPNLTVLLQVSDDSGNALAKGAVDYEMALLDSTPEFPDIGQSPDDLFILYTGGTTGMPKGVLWRQGDIIASVFGTTMDRGSRAETLEQVCQTVQRSKGHGSLPTPPFMHGTGLFFALNALNNGNRLIIQDNVKHLDAENLLQLIEKEDVTTISVVGDAFCRPLIEAMTHTSADISSLRFIVNGGAAISQNVREKIFEIAPNLKIADNLGASESGPQAQITHDASTKQTKFYLGKSAAVLDEACEKILPPGHEGSGWLASFGHVPLGYLGDEEKTKKTFPEISGIRYSIPGDRVRLLPNNELEFQGRDSVTINSGGEKIFAEEVENAVRQHPDVIDTIVSSRASERWGNEVVAILSLAPGAEPDEFSLLKECEKHIARYKLPKSFVFVEKILRGPNGKPDYRWASKLASSNQSKTSSRT